MSTRVTGSHDFLIFGHRGSPRRFPENTVASFEEALRGGADGFETDLRLLSDYSAVLFHDDEWQEREIETLTALDLQQRGADVVPVSSLAAFAARARMILEVKRSNWEDVLLSEIGSWPDIVIASFDHTTIENLAQRRVAFDLGLTIFGRLVDPAGYASRLGVRWLFPNFRYVDRELVDSLHGAGIRVVPWTVNRERDWDRLRDAGCDGLITDLPAEAVEWRRKWTGAG
jgi:glycerophosphoryl diester phosphodiesterase